MSILLLWSLRMTQEVPQAQLTCVPVGLSA
jgi:hypothetical protein